jgi:hypothetical protein
LIKRILLNILIVFISNTSFANPDSVVVKPDTVVVKKESIKKGWNFGMLPAISFDTDLGFQYGGLVNAYNYGDGSRYPKYNHSLYFEISNTTRGSGINRFFYDSDKFIKKCRFSIDISYLNDQAFYFYGFNGLQSKYNPDFIDSKQADYKTRMFYAYKRNLLRIEPVLQGVIYKQLKWVLGVGIYNYDITHVDVDKLNKGKNASDTLPHVDGLYEKYKTWGIIPTKDQNGGWYNHAIAGIAYDTRDNEANPMHGLRDEVLIGVAPSILGNKTNSIKISIIHKQYLTIIKKKLSFCYKLTWQGNEGDVPWYAKQLLLKSYPLGAYSEGVGGGKTVRGILRYRLVGNDFAFGNFEFRYMFGYTRIMKQNFHLGLNTFYDAGIVTRIIPIDFSKIPQSDRDEYFSNKKIDDLHQSAGMGVRVIMNENFIVAFEYGHAFAKQDGKSGFYINMNYLF